jgi:Mlc titration factor MtfA (ptsG expression regulator)
MNSVQIYLHAGEKPFQCCLSDLNIDDFAHLQIFESFNLSVLQLRIRNHSKVRAVIYVQ